VRKGKGKGEEGVGEGNSQNYSLFPKIAPGEGGRWKGEGRGGGASLVFQPEGENQR